MTDDTAKVQFFNALSFAFRLYSKEPARAHEYAVVAQEIAAKLQYKAGEAIAWHNAGLALFNEARFFEAMTAHKNAYSLREQLADTRGLSRSLSGMGLIYQQQGDADKALEAFFRSLRFAETAHDTTGLAVVYFSIGNVYRQQGKFEQSLSYQQEGLKIHRSTGVATNIAYSLLGIGSTFSVLARFDEALMAYNEALAIHTKNNFPFGIAAALNEIGKVYVLQNRLNDAEAAQNQARILQERINDKHGMAVSSLELARIERARQNLDAALLSAVQARSVAADIGAKKLLYEAGFLTAELQKVLGRSNDALSSLENAVKVKDSVVSEEKAKTLAELETRLELRSKEQQIELLEKDNALQATTRNSLLAGILLLVGFIILVLIRYRENKRANAEILRQQTILEEQGANIQRINGKLHEVNAALNEKNEELTALNNEKNEFLGIAAHDLKNPLGSIQLLTEVIYEHSTNKGDERTREMSALILRSTHQMLEMTTNLLDINAIEQGKVHLEVHRLNLSQLVRNVVQINQHRAEAKGISVHLEAQNASLYAIADENALTQVVDNLLSNALKYSPFHKQVWIRLEKIDNITHHQGIVRLSVQDEGPGLSVEDKKKLFGKFARLSAKPTGDEHSTGLGLSIVKRMVEQMNGRVWCESELGNGASFIVELLAA